MVTAERTITMFNGLSAVDQISVKRYIDSFFMRKVRRANHELKPISEDEFVAMIDDSRERAKRGEVYTVADLKRETKEKYGF